MRSTRLFLVAAFIAITATGCGNEGEPSVNELLQRLPSQGRFGKDLMATDLVGAREQLRLPADADPFANPGIVTTVDGRLTNGSESREFREFRLGNLTIQMLPIYLGRALGAFDGREITAAAATRVGTRKEVMILATRQDFDDVAAALKERGFQEEGDLLLAGNEPRPEPSFSAVADTGDGAIVLAGSAEAAEEVLTGGESSEAATVLESVRGVARSASTRIQSDCLIGIAAGQDLEPPEGQIALRIRGEPSADALGIPFRPGSAQAAKNPLAQMVAARFGEPVSTADGFVVNVRYRRVGEPLGVFSVGPVVIPHLATPSPRTATDAEAIYRCP